MSPQEPKSLKEAKYAMFAAAGELFSARSNRSIKDLSPYILARDLARENFRSEYMNHYGERPVEENYEQLELRI